jgi:hypothetical protein
MRRIGDPPQSQVIESLLDGRQSIDWAPARTARRFSHGNFPYLLIATIARLLPEGGEMNGIGAAPAFEGRHAPQVQVPFVFMEAHHAAVVDGLRTRCRTREG